MAAFFAMAKVTVLEWKIENFSCWCEAVHGKCIESPEIFGSLGLFSKVDLYPRGFSGQDDQMKVSFCRVRRNLIGDLTFVCSDGSSISSQQLIVPWSDDRGSGPFLDLKFEEVVAKLRKADRKDEITLRFCIRSVYENKQRMCTTIGVWKISYKIDPELMKSVESNESKDISYFRYSSKTSKGIHLRINRQVDRIQLIMHSPDMENKAVSVESSVSMLSSDNDLVRNEVVKHVFIDSESWVFSESLTEKELEEKGITILLRLKVVNGEIAERYNYDITEEKVSIVPNITSTCFWESESLVPSRQPEDSSTVLLKKDLLCLYQDQDFSDFELKCGDVTFPVHKNILSARSPVFKTMLSCDMREAASGCMDIEDLDPSTLALFLTYLYTGAVEDLECDRALKLYYAADKYLVPTLKRECADFLCDNISIENVCDVLTLADKHKDDALTAVSHDFILNNYSELLGSKEWENFMERESVLALKTVTHFGKKNYFWKIQKP